MDTQVAIDALGVSGTLLSNGLAFANLPAMMEARAQGDLGDINPVVFPILFGNGAAWCLYSVVKKDIYMFGGNILGAVLGLLYVMIAIRVVRCPAERLRLEVLLVSIFLFLSLGGFVARMLDAAAMLGFIALAMVFCLFFSPLTTLLRVVRTKNSASISRPFCVVQMANCVVWLMYGRLVADYIIALPNGFGLVTAILQAVVIAWFPATAVAAPTMLEGGAAKHIVEQRGGSRETLSREAQAPREEVLFVGTVPDSPGPSGQADVCASLTPTSVLPLLLHKEARLLDEDQDLLSSGSSQ